MTGSNLTANISFTYLDGDVVGDETKYHVYKETTDQCASDCVDEANNTGTVTGVNSFSNWTIAELVAPTAAEATISGRLIDSKGRGIEKVSVALTGGNLAAPRYVLTDSGGNYRFEDVPVGETYIITPSSKRYQFAPASRLQGLTEDAVEVNFVVGRRSRIELR